MNAQKKVAKHVISEYPSGAKVYMDESTHEGAVAFDLSELTDFQFGPDWARSQESPSLARFSAPADRVSRRAGDRGDARSKGNKRRDDRAPRGEYRGRPERDAQSRPRRSEAPRRQLPQPAEGLRVEVRPSDPVLTIFATEIQRQKRAHSLLDLARVVMAKGDRYDLVFMKQAGGPMLIHSKREDGSCWLTQAEAVAYVSHAPWFGELYTAEQVQVDPPKGNFTGIAVCSLGNEVIGPVNWHGYQPSLARLYKAKYSSMPMGAFRAAIAVNKDEEAVKQWLAEASVRTVWHPTREDEQEKVLETIKEVEEDFLQHHFTDVYETVEKVFINGAVPLKLLSPGLAAYVSILSGKHRRNPQILIPNLCHGLARHHIPIYKWHGHHYTGPSRIRVVPEGTVLADRMQGILNWTKENSGKKVDAMFAELSGVPAGTDEASKQAAADAYAPYTADMIWLMEQGFILVTNDNSIWYPKGEAAPKAQ